MTPCDGAAYVGAVLALYVDLPDTPRCASGYDKAVARALFERAVPLRLVESALLLGALRRRHRPPGSLPLPPVRSLAYFAPVVDEILHQPLPDGYYEYLRAKAATLSRPQVQKSTFSRDR